MAEWLEVMKKSLIKVFTDRLELYLSQRLIDEFSEELMEEMIRTLDDHLDSDITKMMGRAFVFDKFATIIDSDDTLMYALPNQFVGYDKEGKFKLTHDVSDYANHFNDLKPFYNNMFLHIYLLDMIHKHLEEHDEDEDIVIDGVIAYLEKCKTVIINEFKE
jgi:hypothetical protein